MFATNSVFIGGRLTREPEHKLITLKNGDQRALVQFAIAQNYGQDKTSFFEVKLFGRPATAAWQRHEDGELEKGSPVLVQGRIDQESWETDEGEPRNRHVITAEKIEICVATKPREQKEQSVPI